MCQESSDTTTTPYDPNFERWVMKLRKDYFQRQRQAHLTNANDSSFWPTAQHKDYKRENLPAWEARQQRKIEEGINLQQNLCIATLQNWPTPLASDENYRVQSENWNGTDLPSVVSNWPTPRVSSANGPSESEVKQGNPKRRLETEATIWPTPMQRDYKGFDGPGKKNPLKPPELYHSIHQGQETEKDGHSCSPSCRRLNPLFAEHLMGLPLGWTCVSEPLAMESFQQWQLALSENLQTS
jgi:hypothetical protein